uniref:Uncharacterized protein n=1 Tax=Anguilla anguilla TaxID=7936 RepID=A0A0E9W261_ANGAN
MIQTTCVMALQLLQLSSLIH